MDLLSLAVVGCRSRNCRGQVLAETALVLPFVIFLSGCVIQLAFVGYASCLARYAAFAGLRAAAVAPEKRSPESVEQAARDLIAKAPGVRLDASELSEIAGGRASLSVRVSTPRLVFFLPDELNVVEGRAAAPLEPEW